MIALRLAERLIDLPTDLRPSQTEQLVQDIGDRYDDDPFIAQSVADLSSQLSPPDERAEIWRVQVQRWRDEADKASGVLRYAHRQHALELAFNHGLTDLAEQIRIDLQSMTQEELELNEVSADFSFTAEEIDEYLDHFTSAGTWHAALRRFGAHGPPTGTVEANEAAVAEAAARFPLQHLVGTNVIGAHRSLVYRATTDEARHRLRLVQQEGYGLTVFSPLAARVLDRVAERFGVPDEADLVDFLSAGAIERAVAGRLAAALLYYWRGEYDATGHLLAPRIEAAIRHLCVDLGIVLTKPPQGERPGGVVSLGSRGSR